MGQKSADNIINGIEKSKEVPYERVLFALGIRFVGETVAKKIVKAFTEIDKLIEAHLDELLQVDEIGEKIAQSILQYFNNPVNRNLIERLRMAGLQLKGETKEDRALSTLLEGKSIVISGVFVHHSRDEYKDLIERHGGKNVGSISKKTTFVLAGENMGPAKLEKANSLGVKIMNEEEFLLLIQEQ